MNRDQILAFLADPRSLPAVSSSDETLWRSGLVDVLLPGIRRAGARELRPNQIAAIEGFATARSGLLLGPPGTGKTTVLAWMALGYLLACRRERRRCRVLVTAFTRSAIANVLASVAARTRVLDEPVRTSFLGEAPEDGLDEGVESLRRQDLKDLLQEEHVIVGMTTWSINRALVRGEHGGRGCYDAELFDLLCLDEASQMKVGQGLMALAPLTSSARLVVAGDDRQLAPIGLVAPWTGDAAALGGSLYTFLQQRDVPEFALNETFRLNAALARSPAEFFYQDYVSAKEVANRRLTLRDGWRAPVPAWVQRALDPDFPVCILLHDGPPAATRNPLEAKLAAELSNVLGDNLLDETGNLYGDRLWQEGLAIVTPHRAQNAAIRAELQRGRWADGCVVETVDRVQGRERDAVIVSYAVADPEFALAEAPFLFSPQRFNVAITRPRVKLVLIVSRRLLDVLPPDEEVVDAVGILREYVYGSRLAGSFEFQEMGYPVRVDVRLRGFADDQALPEIEQVAPVLEALPELTPELEELDQAIRTLATENAFGTTLPKSINDKLVRNVPFSDYRALFRLGRITIVERRNQTTGAAFIVLKPVEDGLIPLPLSTQVLRDNLATVVASCRGKGASASYQASRSARGVRDWFVWCDNEGKDALLPILRNLEGEGLCRIEGEAPRLQVEVPSRTSEPLGEAPREPLNDDDFRLLNLLEDLEIARIDMGVVEAWFTPRDLRDRCREAATLAKTFRTLAPVLESLRRLEEHGHVLLREGRVRSRMAELARELRYVKQRFQQGDHDRRPFLVRSLKVVAATRDKPERNVALGEVIAGLAVRFRDSAEVVRAVEALSPALRRAFGLAAGQEPLLSGFQRRALESLLPAWLRAEPLEAAVITAETGAGKTEAAVLPLLVGAAIDRMRGVHGTRAVLVYPRIRLAVNQAARLVRYARRYAEQLPDALVSVGLQTGVVPESWSRARAEWDKAEKRDECPWQPHVEGGWQFPFFRCPDCGAPLRLLPGEPHTAVDTLLCETPACFRYPGWVGTKQGLRMEPPALFLPVTESLHQWMHDTRAGALFGDQPPLAAPRALLADEIHLYSHVHGAQIGWTLRRLLARCRVNGEEAPLALGMSATLGEPAQVWGELCGQPPERVRHITPLDSERRPNPRGREYFYFVQPEVESRGKDIAGASTTIQSLMLLAHGMRRRQGAEGGFRGIAFFDSIDKLKRLHADFRDAEETQRLASLRTANYGADAQDPLRLRSECCREPETCSRFREGECWYFAATDTRQVRAEGGRLVPGESLAVAPTPIFSGTGGNVDATIERSDLVFASSSLEVGYDDPDIALVYQHYAPINLASFVQRKGRGGRGADDRPVTGVTLSVHSSRDAWFFRRPQRMLQAADFRVPINMRNVFVRRGQVLALVLDMASRHVLTNGWNPTTQLPTDLLAETEGQVKRAFGDSIFEDLEVPGLAALWTRVEPSAARAQRATPTEWRKTIDEIPNLLFDPINLPVLNIALPASNDRKEDVALGLGECVPGRVTRRWGVWEAHWVPPVAGPSPWFPEGMAQTRTFSFAPDVTTGAELLVRLPREVQDIAMGGIDHKVMRPVLVQPEVAGTFYGPDWRPNWAWDKERNRAVLIEAKSAAPINHKTQARLQGFVSAVAEREPEPVELSSVAQFAAPRLGLFRSLPGTLDTGLRVVQAYWGSDFEIVLDTPRRERLYHRQVFTHPDGSGRVRLGGYGLRPEGVRLDLDSERIDTFVEDELAALETDAPRKKRLFGQLLRYLLMTRTARIGLNRFEARQLADLFITGVADPRSRDNLERNIRRANPARLSEVVQDIWERHLAAHPQLTPLRIGRLRERLAAPNLISVLAEVWRETAEPATFSSWLRSALLHGLLLRLRNLFVIHGLTDEHRVVAYTRLPLQYGSGIDDRLIVCERSNGGDGTTRAFIEAAATAFADWVAEGFVSCPNADADRALDRAFESTSEHARWRAEDPRDEKWVGRLAAELGLEPEADSGPLQLVLRLLYGREEVGGQRFELFELHGQARAVRDRIATTFAREPADWEVIGGVVRAAREGDPAVPAWTGLLGAYAGIDDALDEGSLAPEARLAEQVYRLSARLCVDGCPACVHLPSELMDDALVEAATSRTLLERFGSFVRGR